MRIELNINDRDLVSVQTGLEAAIEEVRPVVLEAMGDRTKELVLGNFGIAGADRPMAWAPLSPAYAKKVGREIATLKLSGALIDSIKQGGSEGESVTVSVSDSDIPYASVHQTGGRRMPKRPYFPIDDSGKVLDWSKSQIVEAAQNALERELR